MTDKLYNAPEKIYLSKDDVLNEMSFNVLPTQLSINPYNPDDLIMKKGLYTYDKMKDDEAVKVALLLKKTLMLANTVSLEPASNDRVDIEIKDFVEYNLFERLNSPFNKRLESILSAMDYGFSVSEMLFNYIDNHRYFKGKVGLKDLKTRPPHGFDFKTDAYGNLAFLRQFQGQGSYSQDLPVSKFLIHTFNKQFDNHYGDADLRAVYRPWWLKDVTLKFYAIHLERYGTPLLVAYYTGQLSTDENSDLKNILTYLLKGTSFKLPDGKIRIDKLDFQAPQGYEQALDRFDKMITRGLLMPDQLGFTNTSSGTYNAALTQFDMFYLVLKKLLNDVANDMECQVIKPLVNVNFRADRYPKLKFTSIQSEELDKLAGVYTQLTTAGYMSPSNKEDLNFVRNKYDLPEKKVNEISFMSMNDKFKNAKVDINTKNYDVNKLEDFIEAEKVLQKAISDSLVNLTLEQYEKMIDAYNEKDFDAMKSIIEETNEEPLKQAIGDVIGIRYAIGKDSI